MSMKLSSTEGQEPLWRLQHEKHICLVIHLDHPHCLLGIHSQFAFCIQSIESNPCLKKKALVQAQTLTRAKSLKGNLHETPKQRNFSVHSNTGWYSI